MLPDDTAIWLAVVDMHMVLRKLLAVVALVELLAPRPFVDFWMRLAATPDSDVELRDWVYTVARLEGAVILLWVLTRGRGGDGAAAEE
jgi:hypothetical protein